MGDISIAIKANRKNMDTCCLLVWSRQSSIAQKHIHRTDLGYLMPPRLSLPSLSLGD